MAKIVFCEDEERIQKLILATLRSTPHQIYIASDGVEGLDLIERERPDLVLTDVSMPRCDGFQLMDALKSRPHLANTSVVFMTAFAQLAEVKEGYNHGAIGYLTKPFSPAELREKIQTFVSAQN